MVAKVVIKCPVEDCSVEYEIDSSIDSRGYLYLHLLWEHGWSIKKVEAYLNKEGK